MWLRLALLVAADLASILKSIQDPAAQKDLISLAEGGTFCQTARARLEEARELPLEDLERVEQTTRQLTLRGSVSLFLRI